MNQIQRALFSSLVLLIVSFSIGWNSSVWAQPGSTVGNINGVVADEQGAVISGASVTAKNTDTNFTRETLSTETGSYLITQLPPGIYEVSIAADGFKKKALQLELSLGTTVSLDINLALGQLEGEVVVVQADSTINKGKTESSTNVDKGRIESLPINQRNFLNFSLTTARAIVDRRPGQGVTGSSGLSFNAQSGRANNLTIDGLDNNEIFSGAVRQTFSQEAVQEFQVVSDSYSAEFGRATGGAINIVTKSGTNASHGSLFFFNRNDSLSAREPFATFKPEFKQYQFGATLGGAIQKDKTFYFLSFERLSLKQNNIVTISDQVVSSARRQGFNLSNGAIPVSNGITSFLSRLDTQLSPSDKLSFRYNYGGTFNGQFEPFGGLTADSSGSVLRLNDNSVAVANTYLNAPLNFVNETRFLYNKRDQNVFQPEGGRLEGGPQVQILAPEGSILFGRIPGVPQLRDENTFQVINNLSLVRGRHQIKTGIDFAYRRLSKDSEQPIFPAGFALFVPFDFASALGNPNLPFFSALESFDPSIRTPAQRGFLGFLSTLFPQVIPGFPSNVPLADLPLPAVFFQGFGSRRLDPALTTKSFSAFVQDDIQIKPNLLVKLGLRYDINRVRFQPDNNGNIAPRVSIAYSPKQNLSIRASYGIFFANAINGLSFPLQLSTQGSLKIPMVPFPFAVLPFGLLPGRRFPEGDSVPPLLAQLPPQFSLSFQYDKNFKNSYSQQATLGFEYQFAPNTTVGASFVYVRGVKLPSEREANPVVNPLPNDLGLLQSQIFGRLNPARGSINEFSSFTDSYYSGVTISLEHKFANNFGILAHYTYAKALDNVFDFRTDIIDGPNDPRRPDLEKGFSLLDVRNRFVFSGLWKLNYTNNPFLRDFQLSSIITLESGKPYNLIAGIDLNNDAVNPPGDRPLGIARNSGITPGFATVDLRLARTIKIKDRVSIQGLVEGFNLFNRTNIDAINRVFFPGPMGFALPPTENGRFIATPDRFRSAFPPRRIQIGFRLSF